MRVSVHGKRLEVGPDLREEAKQRLHFALGRFSGVIRQVTVYLADVNGPSGGIDKNARVVVLLAPAEQVVAEVTDVTVMVALDRMCHRITRLVSRAVDRRNQSPSTRNVPKSFDKEE